MRESQFLLVLPDEPPIIPDVITSPRRRPPQKQTSAPISVLTLSPATPTPKIDWESEAQLTVCNSITSTDTQNGYRNLSALSAEQLRWVRQNYLEPAKPDIPWTYRRVEMAEGGFPIIHINDHGVAIPVPLVMVFCKIGPIEAKGDLCEPMRDTRIP